ncbi:4-aminobutyrate--2-oxoglutarate transaminase [Halotalea alkalilenta]|uniref:4-aminobutyrate--2-oxoglutarate transaminase n=1 Tax=Halotalea alkalilenta TaxID=376489 RepID=A0A172YGW6_9GAMM|nr:4-aminobutyrate--2-oxoglutarate transaminase [Halotalea alkalilenta]ANF58185.1 4-aminobutyrate--2-oxoglutarate transaminase [Halotalea alkalilenta]
MSNAEWVARKNAATPRGVGVKCEFYVERAENAEIWDIEGNRYIDFVSGVSVNNVGHRHPKVVAAIKAQLDQVIHCGFQVTPYASYVELAEKLNRLTPGDYPKKTTFFSSGAEAVENAVKIARASTGRRAIVAFSGGFHGRTMMGIALTGKAQPYRTGFGPFPTEVHHVAYPNALHGISTEDALDELQRLFKTEVDASQVAAIIFEPVQGEGGFVPAPLDFVQGLRALCDQHGIVLIADEIQTGFGRTGKLFAMEHYGVAPDLMTMAKSIAGGVPLSAVCGRAEIMDGPGPGGLGGTFAGNPLAIAAAHAVLEVIEEEGLVERANLIGSRLVTALEALRGVLPNIAEVRGKGSMVAIELLDDAGEPAPAMAQSIQAAALRNGVLTLVCGFYGNVIRFLHPLTMPLDVLDEGIDKFSAAVREHAKSSSDAPVR